MKVHTHAHSLINLWLVARKLMHAIYLDLSKAFEKVPHTLPLHKLENYGIGGSLLSCMVPKLLNK
jgi:non-ribosomal peptide synthetase component F